MRGVMTKGAVLLALLALGACATPKDHAQDMVFKKTSFAKLDGWKDHNPADALATFRKSCDKIIARPDNASMGPNAKFGKVADWKPVCYEAYAFSSTADELARVFVETHFTPYRVYGPRRQKTGLITGYYEPVMEGSFQPMPGYDVPLYGLPDDLITVDLALFRSDLKGRRIAGRVENGRLIPFHNRSQIEDGALGNRSLELMWLKDPVDAFFLHIQGSGRVRLPNGDLQMVGYAGPNGHPYTPIGRILIERGEVKPEHMSMQAIRAWINENPDEGVKLMRENRSYIFFRLLEGEGPLGAQNVALTPYRSLAVDRTLWAYGTPIWVVGTHPDPNNTEGPSLAFSNLMVAQDTGGAIRGPIRGDVFWGMGDVAETIAGHMADPAMFYALLPKTIGQ